MNLDTVTTDTVTTDTVTTDLGTKAGWEQLWAQTHALRTVAGLLDRLALPGLSLTIDDEIVIQVPQSLGDAAARARICTLVATAIGATATTDTRPGHTHGWIRATGHLAGHPVKVFTAITNPGHAIEGDTDHDRR